MSAPQRRAEGSDYPALGLLLEGAWREGLSRHQRPVVDPGTEEVIGQLPIASPEDVDEAANAALKAFATWRRVPAFDRRAVLVRAAQLLRADAERIARAVTLESGKPLHESRAEVGVAADTLDWFAGEAQRSQGRLLPAREPGREFRVEQLPVGPVAAFCAWNAPVANAVRKVAPALAAGCTVVLKASEETPGGAVELALALNGAGLPKGALNLVFGDPPAIAAQLIDHAAIRKISFTGSTTVGKELARRAASLMKPATMELGGHAPVLVFDDVDVEAVAAASVRAKYRNAGHICFSPTRFFVQEAVVEPFVDAFRAEARALKVGHGLEPGTEMGPLAHARRMDAVAQVCADAERRGARGITGGEARPSPGYFWKPTAFRDVPLDAALMTTEPFGPVAAINPFGTLDEAITEANRLPYGLSAYVFTRSRANARAMVDGIESGTIGLNTFLVVLPETPFGGERGSGVGREGGPEGMLPYLVTRFTHWA